MAATRNQLLARLHCIKKEQGWSDDEYRDILQARTGARSGADLDAAALARVVAALGAQCASRAGKSALTTRRSGEWSFVDSASADRVRRLRYIIVLCGQLGIKRGGQKAYAQGIAENMDASIRHYKDGRHVGDTSKAVKKPLEFCTADELGDIVNALEMQVKRIERRTQGKAP